MSAPVDLVFLHGRAAAGKLTTARELERRLHFPVFHNHLVVDMLLILFPFGSEPFVRLREQIWLSVFGEAAAANRSLIFTFTPEQTVPADFPSRVERVIESAGGQVRWIRLLVGDQEQEHRIDAASRRQFNKLSDIETLRRSRNQPPGEQPPVQLEIDTEQSGPEATARQIIEHFALQATAGLLPPYPNSSVASSGL
jgi:hypothetical protein